MRRHHLKRSLTDYIHSLGRADGVEDAARHDVPTAAVEIVNTKAVAKSPLAIKLTDVVHARRIGVSRSDVLALKGAVVQGSVVLLHLDFSSSLANSHDVGSDTAGEGAGHGGIGYHLRREYTRLGGSLGLLADNSNARLRLARGLDIDWLLAALVDDNGHIASSVQSLEERHVSFCVER